ncbi:putative phage terminase [Streptomyces scabiei 87.22]|uniref:Putative phage terminase n=1 Tax=Streptomyces scabiei (strain 87.22) TaxID=680198 RepID=C9Z939_STRSW|nr:MULTISPECIES: terminase [Streptomyces]MBP5875667.1 terminase [Streptomyces sp. LBUM 1477]MDX2652122.1 terminase [Streptomyces scabiei]MDX2725852.1 terminase [Streptomyces scabiei]MDX2749642.1 terminase [Streptomyces scabiei]MDX2863971.1 terminase [Streptomyces scabiei]
MGVLHVPAPDAEPWPTLGPQVCEFLEERCVHGPGDLRGDDYQLDAEKRALIYRWYEVYPQNHPRAGRRRFKRVGLSVRKGTAKTELAAAVAYAELHVEAPVRCDGFDSKGRPVGRPVRDPYIPMVAYTEEQTSDLAYGALYVMCTEGPDADLFDSGLERIMRIGGDGKAQALASSPDSRDGARTTFQHFDETHRFVLPRLREAHQTMLANIPKRMLADPWSLETTTTYTPGEGSVAEGTHEYAELVAEEKVKDRALCFFHREATPREGEDLSDDEQLRAAIREASGPAIASWPDFEGQVDYVASLYNHPDTDRSYYERVWLNRRVQAGRQAFDVRRWRDELARPDFVVPDGDPIAVGFDGAQFRDATALIATHIETGFQWPLGIWECPPGETEWECPEDEVDDALVEAFDRFHVIRVYADPPYWDGMVVRWKGRWGEKRVTEWWTNRPKAMAYSVRAYHRAMKAGDVSHNGDETFARHIANARKRVLKMLDEDGQPLWVIEKERHDSPFKMDGAMAGDLSWEARSDAIKAGQGRPKKKSKMVIMR